MHVYCMCMHSYRAQIVCNTYTLHNYNTCNMRQVVRDVHGEEREGSGKTAANRTTASDLQRHSVYHSLHRIQCTHAQCICTNTMHALPSAYTMHTAIRAHNNGYSASVYSCSLWMVCLLHVAEHPSSHTVPSTQSTHHTTITAHVHVCHVPGPASTHTRTPYKLQAVSTELNDVSSWTPNPV